MILDVYWFNHIAGTSVVREGSFWPALGVAHILKTKYNIMGSAPHKSTTLSLSLNSYSCDHIIILKVVSSQLIHDGSINQYIVYREQDSDLDKASIV